MRPERKWILAAATALWLAVAGCGDVPTAPRVDPGPGVPSSPGGGSAVVDASGAGAIIQPIEPIQGGLQTTAEVDGAAGGLIQVDAVTVSVPPAAFTGDAQIKVTIPDSTKLAVRLEIDPPDKNHFLVPVRLEFDARAMGKDPRVMVIYWKNPVDNRWVAIPTDVDMRTGKVSADLAHFSEYECDSEVQGKAGW